MLAGAACWVLRHAHGTCTQVQCTMSNECTQHGTPKLGAPCSMPLTRRAGLQLSVCPSNSQAGGAGVVISHPLACVWLLSDCWCRPENGCRVHWPTLASPSCPSSAGPANTPGHERHGCRPPLATRPSRVLAVPSRLAPRSTCCPLFCPSKGATNRARAWSVSRSSDAHRRQSFYVHPSSTPPG